MKTRLNLTTSFIAMLPLPATAGVIWSRDCGWPLLLVSGGCSYFSGLISRSHSGWSFSPAAIALRNAGSLELGLPVADHRPAYRWHAVHPVLHLGIGEVAGALGRDVALFELGQTGRQGVHEAARKRGQECLRRTRRHRAALILLAAEELRALDPDRVARFAVARYLCDARLAALHEHRSLRAGHLHHRRRIGGAQLDQRTAVAADDAGRLLRGRDLHPSAQQKQLARPGRSGGRGRVGQDQKATLRGEVDDGAIGELDLGQRLVTQLENVALLQSDPLRQRVTRGATKQRGTALQKRHCPDGLDRRRGNREQQAHQDRALDGGKSQKAPRN